MQEPRGKIKEPRSENQETRIKKQETRDKNQETRNQSGFIDVSRELNRLNQLWELYAEPVAP
jgi:hypothetical protein